VSPAQPSQPPVSPLVRAALRVADLGRSRVFYGALGLTEVSDALAIVISEETGKIAMARAGRLKRNLSADELYATLEALRTGGKGVV